MPKDHEKHEEPETPKVEESKPLRKFFFPNIGLTIEAATVEEAEAKAAELVHPNA